MTCLQGRANFSSQNLCSSPAVTHPLWVPKVPDLILSSQRHTHPIFPFGLCSSHVRGAPIRAEVTKSSHFLLFIHP